MADYRYVTYETLDEGTIARIMLNRPESRNAQQRGMLVELNEAFLQAEADDDVRVVILGGNGPMFSSGHDLGSKVMMEEYKPGPNQHPSFTQNGATREGAEKLMLQEWHYFFENTRRWRNLRKITVAQVHGDVYAAALMLMWSCDLIVAADNTTFADVVGTRLGMCGVEYFAHPWEFGARKTKELMLTGDSLSVDEAHALGMVSKVFPADELAEKTLEFAAAHRQGADHGRNAHQGIGQPDTGQPRLLQLAERVFHDAPAQPQPLGVGARGRLPSGQRDRRPAELARGPASGPRSKGQGQRLAFPRSAEREDIREESASRRAYLHLRRGRQRVRARPAR